MDLQEWKAEAEQKLQNLARTIHDWAPASAYGAMSVATLWPVIQAANQDPLGAAVALGSVLGAGGGGGLEGGLRKELRQVELEGFQVRSVHFSDQGLRFAARFA